MSPDDGLAPAGRFGMLRTIALYKLLKVLLLLAAAYGELRLHDSALSAKLVTWAEARPAGLEHEVVTAIRDADLCGGVRHRGNRFVDAQALGGVADVHRYRVVDSARSMGVLESAESRQGGGGDRECGHRWLPGVARALETPPRRRIHPDRGRSFVK